MLAVAIAAGGSHSQTLDLSGPEAPAAGRGVAALEVASRLDRAADRIASSGATTGLDELRSNARAGYRTAFATLAELGESMRDDGSPVVLWAMTIDVRADGIDALIDGSTDAALLAALAADLDALDLAWSRGEPIDAARLDEQIGSAFAALAQRSIRQSRPGVGWFRVSAGATADDVRERASALAELGASEATIEALDAVADEIEMLSSWPTYRARGAAQASGVVEAIDAVRSLPEWTPSPARERLITDVSEALRLPMSDRQTSLALAARHADLLASLDRMEAGREANRLRARAADAIATRATDDDQALRASTLAAQTIALSVSRQDVREDDHIARELRPAWRRIVPLVRAITVDARDQALDLLIDPDKATDPGVLAAVARQRRLFDDFALLERLSVRLEQGLDGPPELIRAVRDRLLGVSQSADDDALREQALAMLRAFDEQLATLDRIERDAETAVRVMGARGQDMPLRILEMREAWLRGWAVPAGSGPDQVTLAELDLLARLAALLADAEAFTRLDTVMTWPGFEMSVRARRAIAEGLTERIDELVPDAMRGGNAVGRSRSESRIRTLRGENAAALLAGRLSRLGRDAGVSLADPIEEIALGPPVESSWMGRHREAIADLCRYAEEFGRLAMTTSRDDPELAKIRSLVNWRALRLLERIERE